MEDPRNSRQIVIDRIISYVDGVRFYDKGIEPNYDFDNMTDVEIIRAFELLIFDYVRIRNEYRANNPDPRVTRR